jgi:hypothetical protein
MPLNSLAVFVNTSDGYKDCWPLFFQLFDRYAGALRERPVYLNTERLSFAWPGLSVVSTAVWPVARAERPGWGERCSAGLHAVHEPFVLYLQEDYFMTGPARGEVVENALAQLERDDSLGVVYLNAHGPRYRRSRDHSEGLIEILPPAGYLVNTQAAVWRRDFLLSLIEPWENVWMFEKFASVRGLRGGHRFLAVAPAVLAESPVFDYGNTGIARGQWQMECVPLFEREGLAVDFSRRGFYQMRGRLKFRLEVLARVFGNPADALRSLRSLV